MSTKNIELLERAVINLTIENAELKKDLETSKKDKDYWYSAFDKQRDKAEDLQSKLEHHLGLPKATDQVVLTGTNEEETE